MGLEPMASGVTVGRAELARKRSTSQATAIPADDAAATSPNRSALAGFRPPFGIPLVSEIGAPSDPLLLLSVREVAERLKVARSTVYKICGEGKLPHARVSNAIRVSKAALADYLQHSVCRTPAVRGDRAGRTSRKRTDR